LTRNSLSASDRTGVFAAAWISPSRSDMRHGSGYSSAFIEENVTAAAKPFAPLF
jgi:hypothetical protein